MSSHIHLSWSHAVKLSYEIYVDGKAAVMSGLMSVNDASRLLVAEIPSDARELMLVVRADNGMHRRGLNSCWGDPAFYK
jgi:hypothetical protein